MTKSIMEMTDEILKGCLSESESQAPSYHDDLPQLTDDQRDSLLNESMSEGAIPFDPDARKQHTAQGMSKNTLGRKKPKKTMGTPPGFEKTPEEKAAAKKAENASLYPRIVLKQEQLDSSKPHQPSDANAQARAAQKAKSTQSRKTQSLSHSMYPKSNADSNSGPDSAHQRGRGKKAGQSGHQDTRSQGSASARSAETWRQELSKAKDPKKHGASQIVVPGKGGQKYAKSAHADALKTSRDKGQSGITSVTANLSRKQHAVLKEALSILKEVTSVGGIGMGGSANKCYDADAKPMGKDNVPIKGVDASLKKMTKKGSKNKKMVIKGSEKVDKKTSKKDKKEMENSSFSRFLGKIVNETVER